MLVTIPKSQIQKCKAIYNSGKLTMEQLQKQLGCQYLINTVLFKTKTFELQGQLTVDGKVLCALANHYGYAINGDKMVFSYLNNVKYPDFMGCYHVLVRDGEVVMTKETSDKLVDDGRSCIGMKPNGDIVLMCDQRNQSLMEAAMAMYDAGCTVALNYDGGGSCQMFTPSGTVRSSRIVPAYLAIWTKEQEDKPTNDEKEEENDMLKVLLIAGHGDGDPGAVANGVEEADETRAIVSNLNTQLQGICQVDIYPTERNAYKDLKAGALAVNWSDYDYVLEIHLNASKASEPDDKTKGVECYVTTSEGGISVEQAICNNIASLGLSNRGVKRKNWEVIQSARSAGVSSALLEVCFLDDPDDMEIYQANKAAIATAIAAGIVSGFGLQAAKPEQPQPWYQEAMEFVVANGIADGTRPDAPCTRAEAWTMLMRLARLMGGV